MKHFCKGFIFGACIALVLAGGAFAAGSKDNGQEGEIVLKWASIWVGKDSKAPAVEELVQAYNNSRAGKVRVVIEAQPDYNAYEEKIRTSIAARQAPADIFTIKYNPTTAEFYKSDLLMDFAKIDDPAWFNTFDQGALQQAKVRGVQRSLPMEKAILPIWYNMKALKSAGINDVPQTMDEMWRCFDALKAKGIAPTSQMTGDTNAWTSMIWFSHFAVSFGGVNVWEKSFTDPAFVQAANMMKRIISEYSTKDAVGLGAGGSGGHFLAGRTALFANGPWYAGRSDLAQTDFFNSIKIAGIPAAGSTKNFLISRPQANICAAATKNKARQEAIIDFLKFLTAPANIKKIEEASGAMFAVKTDYVPANPLQKQFYDLDNNVPNRSFDLEAAFGSEVTLEFEQQLSALVLGRIDAETFCKLVNEKFSR